MDDHGTDHDDSFWAEYKDQLVNEHDSVHVDVSYLKHMENIRRTIAREYVIFASHFAILHQFFKNANQPKKNSGIQKR